MKTITVKRVCYGSDKTPVELREYTLGPGFPVGTQKEIIEFYTGFPEYKEILFMDKDGTIERKIKL